MSRSGVAGGWGARPENGGDMSNCIRDSSGDTGDREDWSSERAKFLYGGLVGTGNERLVVTGEAAPSNS